MIIQLILWLVAVLIGWYHPEIIAAFRNRRNGS